VVGADSSAMMGNPFSVLQKMVLGNNKNERSITYINNDVNSTKPEISNNIKLWSKLKSSWS